MNTSKKPVKQKEPVKECVQRYSLIEELYIVSLFFSIFRNYRSRWKVQVETSWKIRYNAQKLAVPYNAPL